MIPSCNDTYFEYFYEGPPVDAINRKEYGCYITKEFYDSDCCWVMYTDSPEYMRRHPIPVSTIKQEGSTESCKEVIMNDKLTDFVDHLNVFPALKDFNASSVSEALKWTDFVQDTVYQIVSTCTVNTQQGQTIILSLQKADVSCCSAWA